MLDLLIKKLKDKEKNNSLNDKTTIMQKKVSNVSTSKKESQALILLKKQYSSISYWT